jgi:hypothetical protein
MKIHPKPDSRPVNEKTLDELEGTVTGPPPYRSHVVTEVHRLRHVPLKRYRLEDLRLMIGQGNGLPFLIPLALEHLSEHPLAHGDFYPGDLLAAVARVPESFWKAHPHLLGQLTQALRGAVQRLKKIHTTPEAEAELLALLASLERATGRDQ